MNNNFIGLLGKKFQFQNYSFVSLHGASRDAGRDVSNDKSIAWYLNDISLSPRERIQTDGAINAPPRFQEKYKKQIKRNKVAK
jgi:hypothetical protein